MKFLIVGSIYHPEEMVKARQNAHPGESVLFPPSQDTFFWVRSLRKLGHEVDAFIRNVPALLGWRSRRLDRFTGTRGLTTLVTAFVNRVPRAQPDFWVRNRRLSEAVAQFEPDAILIVGGNRVIFPETLAAIKAKHGCKIVFMSGDSPIVFGSGFERAAAPLYDLVLVNDYYHGVQWLELGAAKMEALPLSAVDPDFHHAYELSAAEQTEFTCNVGFVGTLLPPNLYSRRAEALAAVGEFGLGVWSVHNLPPALQPYWRGSALGEKMLKALCGSKIQVNPHGNFMRYGGNLRLFEAPGCGVFQIADDVPGVSAWFKPGETVETFSDQDQLREKVAYYLNRDDERRQIAQASQAHVYAHHTYDHRMAALVSLLS